jgi:stage IV sporulation protein FB
VRWSFKIFRLAGIDIEMHVGFPIMVAWFALSQADSRDALLTVAQLLLMFACVLLHELGHALAARRYGVTTRKIVLLPFGGVAQLERMPEKPSQELVVALAGPGVNVIIATGLAAFLLAKGVTPEQAFARADKGLPEFLLLGNLVMLLFNLVPAFPMDGGRVLRALLATRLGHLRATEIAASIGQLVAFGLGFLGLFGNPLLIFIAVFVYLAASSEAQLVAIRAMSRDVPVSAAMMTEFATLTPDEHIDAAVETLLRTSQSVFPVIDADHRLVGVLDRDGMIRALKTLGPDARVQQAMTTDVPTVGARSCLEDAFRILQERSAPAVGIVDVAGRLAGLITSETVGEMLMVREALPKGARIGPWSGTGGPVTETR